MSGATVASRGDSPIHTCGAPADEQGAEPREQQGDGGRPDEGQGACPGVTVRQGNGYRGGGHLSVMPAAYSARSFRRMAA